MTHRESVNINSGNPFVEFSKFAHDHGFVKKIVGDDSYRKLRRKNGKYPSIKLISVRRGVMTVLYYDENAN